MSAPLDGDALGRWVEIALPDAPWGRPVPFVGYVYMDWQAGMSAKGGPADRPDDPPSLTVRLPIGAPSRVLDAAEVGARVTPPAWVAHFGPQPPTDAPWRRDPALRGRWHKQFPDDLQVLVHDGEPRRTQRAAEGCWVRVDASEPAPARPSASADGVAIARGAVVYVGTLLNQPHKLTTLAQGDRVRFLPDPGGRHPLLVTEAYLAERAGWTIAPCPRCGLGEGLDPPSVMAATRFPDAGGTIEAFTAHCVACGPPSALSFSRRAPA